ncbi:hypothetical protein MIZ01_2346 [Sideroxyarcus emersonii]|uniref:Uncharacterized protein TP-0789 domain-containing protein n=2 Tax=Sideroxyarcus emersonii TaxID=2764705 RepID=A0AAN1XBQ0_9PROT|nr:hypothetical protein MIZ01_2346 [Sideroxyarcus emersonii]
MRRVFGALLFGLCCLGGPAAAVPDANRILQDADRARGGSLPGIVWEIRVTSHDADRVAEPQRMRVMAMGDASVAETLEPARLKGYRVLQVGRDMWLARPGLSRPVPISPHQRLIGQAANGDIAATNYAGDYDARLAGTEPLAGEACYVLDLHAKNKRVTYDRIRYWVSVRRMVGIKAEFESVSGKLLKTARFEYGNTIEAGGKSLPFVSRMVIEDALSDAETTMEFSGVQVRQIDASAFDLGQAQ